jgi:hypothetical protein
VIFGGYPSIRDGATTPQQATTTMQTQVGAPLRLVRVYDTWNSAFPTSYINWLRSTDHTPVLSIKARRPGGPGVPLSAVASAKPGSSLYGDIVRWANAVKGYGSHIYVTLQHEPELSDNGDPTSFRAAWRNFVNIFRSQGVTNAEYVYIAAAPHYWKQYVGTRQDARLWYPGDDVVDDIAVDAFNLYCFRPGSTKPVRPWMSLQSILQDFRQFGASHPTKRLFVTEFGTPEDLKVPGRKAKWISDAEALFQQPGWSQFSAIMYWNARNNRYARDCDFGVNTSDSSVAAIRHLTADPYYSAPDSSISPQSHSVRG